jgi:hypothetical protein
MKKLFIVTLFFLMATTHLKADENTPLVSLYRLLFWHASDIWALRQASEDISTATNSTVTAQNMIIEATNKLASITSQIETQEVWTLSFGWPMEDRTPPNERQNVLGECVWRSNVWVNGTLFHDHYVHFNELVSTNPAVLNIEYSKRLDDGSITRWTANVTTNSYPNTSVVDLEHGSYTCYWFRCQCPTALTNCVIDWDREVVFGAPLDTESGFNVMGVFLIDDEYGDVWEGISYTNVVGSVTNLWLNGLKVEAK